MNEHLIALVIIKGRDIAVEHWRQSVQKEILAKFHMIILSLNLLKKTRTHKTNQIPMQTHVV